MAKNKVKVVTEEDLHPDDFTVEKGKLHMKRNVQRFPIILNDSIKPDSNVNNRNCTFESHAALCEITLNFTMARDISGIEYIGSLPNECPKMIYRIDQHLDAGGYIYIKENSRGILARGLKAGKAYNVVMRGWLNV